MTFSDNGAPFHYGGSNLPLKGDKHTLYEGGMRVPTLIRSALLPPSTKGTENGGFYSVTDWLPTLVKLAGGTTTKNKPLDGFDIWPSIANADTPSPRTELFHCAVDPSRPKTSMKGPWAALRVGDLKLLQGKKGNFSLFNISEDPNETTDLAADSKHATELAALQKRLDYYRNDSVPGWSPEAACQSGLGPLTVNGSLVWAPTCKLVPTPPTPAPLPTPTPAPGPGGDCATGAGMLKKTCFSPHHNKPTQIRNFSASSAKDCCSACQQNNVNSSTAAKPCLAWTWREKIDSLCVLLDEAHPNILSDKDGCTSGKRNSSEHATQ